MFLSVPAFFFTTESPPSNLSVSMVVTLSTHEFRVVLSLLAVLLFHMYFNIHMFVFGNNGLGIFTEIALNL